MAPAFTGQPSSTFLVFTPLRSPSQRPGRSSASLPWDSSGLGSLPARFAPLRHSRGPLNSPLRRLFRARPLPVTLAGSLRLRRYHLRSPVPSPWFLTTSTASSAHGLRACFIPLPTLGFAAFLAALRLRSPAPRGASRTRLAASPRRVSYPPKMLSTAAAPHRWGRCLPGVRSHIAARAHPQGVARRSNPMVAPPACAAGTPSFFLGFAPLRGHPEAALPRRFLLVRSVLGHRLRGRRVSLGRSFRNAGPREARIRSLPRLNRPDRSGRPPRKSVRTGISARFAAGSNRFDRREFAGPPWGL
jgi:hypothetical protein